MRGTVWRSSWRYALRHPWQLALAVLGVALGVAVVVAVDLANDSARRAFALSMEDVAGRATHQIVGGPAGLDDSLYTQLRVEAGVRRAAPAVEAWGKVDGQTVHLLGVDPFAEADFRAHLEGAGDLPLRRLLVEPGTVMMTGATAARLGVAAGDAFAISFGGRERTARLAALLEVEQEAAVAMEGMLVADIATAQELLGQEGRLSWIDLILPEGSGREEQVSRLRALLPADAELVTAASRGNAMREMSRAFHTNLTAMSLLALVVGMFLIYNTMTFAVLQRRTLIANLRVLGVTRREIFQVVLGEAVVLGVAGTIAGICVGIVLGNGLVHLITRSINDLYFAVTVSALFVSPLVILKGVALGIGATLVAALAPAWEAAGTAPQAAMHRSVLEARSHRLAPRLALIGLAMLTAALVVLAVPDRALLTGFIALFLLILGFTLITPWVVARVSAMVTPVAGRTMGVQARLAARGVGASLSRTGVAIAALMLAVSTTVGVGVMIDSFRSTVEVWLQSTLRADIYVSTPSLRSTRSQPELDPAVLERLRNVPGIANISSARGVVVEVAGELTEVFTVDMGAQTPHFTLKHGDPSEVLPRFVAGELVLVSEPLAYRRGIGVGDTVALRTDAGLQRFSVGGVYYDYDAGPGVVAMGRALYDRHWNDRAVEALGLYLTPDTRIDDVLAAVHASLAGMQEVIVFSNRELRRSSLEIFDRTFTITGVLRMLAVLVAVVGILSALMALQLERGREFAILRATGFTPGQVSGLISVQTGLMGLVAGVLAVPVGLALALVLIHVINRRAFGWSMQTEISAGVLGFAVVLAVGAALAAGLYPAWRMARATPAAALREE